MIGGIGSHMPIRKTFWYSVGRDDQRFQLPTVFKRLDDIAVDAAEDYHGNHDGWEDVWPVLITIYETEEGPSVAQFDVERETVPQFHAWERKPVADCAVDPVVQTQADPSTREKGI